MCMYMCVYMCVCACECLCPSVCACVCVFVRVTYLWSYSFHAWDILWILLIALYGASAHASSLLSSWFQLYRLRNQKLCIWCSTCMLFKCFIHTSYFNLDWLESDQCYRYVSLSFFIGCNVSVPSEVIVLNSIVLPYKDLPRSYKNEIIL